MSHDHEAKASAPAQPSPTEEDDILRVMEVIPPGIDARSTAESLLRDADGDPSAALNMYFSKHSGTGNDESLPSTSALHHTSPKQAISPIRNPYGNIKLNSGRKRPLPGDPFAHAAETKRKSACSSSQTPISPSKSDKVLNKKAQNRPRNDGPLAERVRPTKLSDVIGQESFSPDSPLGKLLAEDKLPSTILWGPPGSGKTTIAGIICRTTKRNVVKLSATKAGVKEVRSIVEEAEKRRALCQPGTVLFLDEVHRWNKAQQDTLLPHVESGLITLVGATTENPSFSLNSALLSRCRVVVLEKLGTESTMSILKAALANPLSELPKKVEISDAVLSGLAGMADGDARAALNTLELAVNMSKSQNKSKNNDEPIVVSAEMIQKSLQRSNLLYDRDGEEHYNIISALHKSMRAGDADAALYWLARMLESGEDARYVTRRLVRFASEDIGLADPMALLQATAAHNAAEKLGMPECDVVVAQAVVYLARAPKSVAVYKAYKAAKDLLRGSTAADPVPLHIRNAPTGLMKDVGYGKGYVYPPENNYRRGCVDGFSFFPRNIENTKLFHEDDVEPGHELYPK